MTTEPSGQTALPNASTAMALGVGVPDHDPAWVVIAKIGRPYGVKGQVWLHVFCDPIEGIHDHHEVHLWQQGAWQPFDITFTHNIKKHQIAAILPNVNTPEAAKVWTHGLLAVPRHTLPELPQGEHYWHDLMSCRIYNTEGADLGHVTSISGQDGHAMFVALRDQERRYIPYIDDVVVSIDTTSQKIIVDWPEQI